LSEEDNMIDKIVSILLNLENDILILTF